MGKRQRRLGTAAEPAAAAPNPSGREGRRRTERGEEDEQSAARRKGRPAPGGPYPNDPRAWTSIWK